MKMRAWWMMAVAGMVAAGGTVGWAQEEETGVAGEAGEVSVVDEEGAGGPPALRQEASEEAVVWDAEMEGESRRANVSKDEGDKWREGLALVSPVMDYAGLLGREERLALIDKIRAGTASNGAQLVVATVKSLRGGESRDFATKLFEQWGVGEKGKDNGVLFLLSVEERRVEIEVGMGFEGALPDAKCGRLLDRAVVPALKKDNWKAGIYGGCEALLAVMAGEDFEEAVSRGSSLAGEIMKWTVLGVFVGVPIWAMVSNRKRRKEGGGDDAFGLSAEDAQRIQREHSEILDAAEAAGFPKNKGTWDKILDLYAEFGKETVLSGISACVDQNVIKPAYLRKCCINIANGDQRKEQDPLLPKDHEFMGW